MAKELSAEMQKVYDYIISQESIHDTIMNNNDSIIASNACAVSTALWAVKQFIDVNFKDDKCSSIENCIHKSPTNKCGCIKDCQYKNK